ncbi:hypothetical protein, partial [Pseudomonas sp. WC2]|uniref:hypothetical protein n=1 Tax=Pseudomonas sp. WC2 TaxID=3424773 RepID=UPI003D35617D
VLLSGNSGVVMAGSGRGKQRSDLGAEWAGCHLSGLTGGGCFPMNGAMLTLEASLLAEAPAQ